MTGNEKMLSQKLADVAARSPRCPPLADIQAAVKRRVASTKVVATLASEGIDVAPAALRQALVVFRRKLRREATLSDPRPSFWEQPFAASAQDRQPTSQLLKTKAGPQLGVRQKG